MAHTAHDTDRRPSYFQGSDYLAQAIGGAVAGVATAAGERAVLRAVKELAQLGVIRQDRSSNRSKNRRWWLQLDQP
jgi:hypothetical protein